MGLSFFTASPRGSLTGNAIGTPNGGGLIGKDQTHGWRLLLFLYICSRSRRSLRSLFAFRSSFVLIWGQTYDDVGRKISEQGDALSFYCVTFSARNAFSY